MFGWFRDRSYRLLIVVFVLGAGLGYFGNETLSLTGGSEASNGSFEEKQRIFDTVVSYVRDMYVDEEKIEADRIYYGAIEGLINSLDDPHTRLMKPDQYSDMKTEINQEFGGLGIYITIRNGELTVIAPIQGTPAFEAGLQPGDVIAEINGNSTKDLTSADEAVKKLRGPKDSTVDLTIARRGERFEVTITRGEIPIKSVFTSMIDEEDGIGYLKITNFGEETHTEVKEKLQGLHEDGMESLVVDVRNNPGGSLRSAHEVADFWINEDRIVYTRGRAPGQDKDYEAQSEGTEPIYPMTILANKGSASGSEILVGALKDHGRAVVMGDTTFGKGLVQSVFPLQDGSALALTTARYYTPDGHMIQGTGIPPHITVEQTVPDTGVQRNLAQLSRGDTVLNFVRDKRPIENEDVEELTEELRSQGIELDERFIRNEIRRQELALDGKTMVASPSTDPQLREALDYFNQYLDGDESGPISEMQQKPVWF